MGALVTMTMTMGVSLVFRNLKFFHCVTVTRVGLRRLRKMRREPTVMVMVTRALTIKIQIFQKTIL